MIHSAQTNKTVCHPGIRKTLFFVKQRFWWPNAKKDATEYVNVCPRCATNKPSLQKPSGELHPLSTALHPWSEISFNFLTGLPLSGDKTTILTVVDRFSKMVHFVARPKLPSAK